MAITFSKSISELKLLNAFNNNVVEFYSDNVLDSTKCTINIGGLDFEITPINNVFRFNFKEIVSVLINDNNFKDEVLPNENIEVDNTLKDSYTVTYTITFSDSSTENTSKTYAFVKTVEQIANVSNRLLTEQQILANKELTFFKGYPFDIGHYSDGDITVTNTTNGGSGILNSTATNTDRFFFGLGDSEINDKSIFESRVLADGGTYENNSCWLETPLLRVGYNNITIAGGTTENLTIKLNDINCGGTYLKWFNIDKGAWHYWLFHPIYKESLKTKEVDEFNTDFESIDNTYTTSLIMGKTAKRERKIASFSLNNYEMLQIKSIFVSPRVEMYNGSYGDSITSASWQTVKVKDSTVEIVDTKRDLIDVKLTIEINEYTNI